MVKVEWSKCASNWITGTILIILASPTCAAFFAQEYLPLPEGAIWNYSGPMGGYSSQVIEGGVIINGVLTIRVDDGEGDSEYYANDENGLVMHRVDVSEDGINAEVVFDPPIPILNQIFNLGDQLNSSGIAWYDIAGYGIFPIDYATEASVISIQQTEVPYGTFDTVYMTLTVTLSGNILGTPVFETGTDGLWLARGIGPIRIGNPSDGEYDLISTNIEELLNYPAVEKDFDNDGDADVLMYHDTYKYRLFTMQDGAVQSIANPGLWGNPSWQYQQ